MNATVSTDFLLRVAQATPEQQAVMERVLAGAVVSGDGREAQDSAMLAEIEALRQELAATRRELEEAKRSATLAASRAAQVKFAFRDLGDHFEIIFEGRPRFTLPKNLGGTYLDYLLHHPNKPEHALKLEMRARAEKETARAEDTAQAVRSARAKQKVQEELRGLARDLLEAEEAGNGAAVERLKQEILAVKAADKTQMDITADSGERARNNVRKAITAVIRHLYRGNKHQKAFAAHLAQFVSLGYEVSYNQPGGDLWE